MFGSTLLDVVLGMIFVYLLLSLICSAANELIEGLLKNRAIDLERGIRELLDPDSDVSEKSKVSELYNHPLIKGLYKGNYGGFASYRNKHLLWRWLVRFFRAPELPSYIPSRNLALALMDTIKPAQAGGGIASPQQVINLSGASGATSPTAPAAPPAHNPFQLLRDAVAAMEIEQAKRALLPLLDAAGNDINKARENIEEWFNSSMDRVSGWYKRRAQIFIFILGFIIAVALNADSITLVKSLSTDKAARDSLVIAAEAYAKANGSQTAPSPSPTVSTPPTTAMMSKSAATSLTPVSMSLSPSDSLPECKDENSPECKIAKNLQEIKKLSLPIGWGGLEADLSRRWPGNNWSKTGGWWHQLYWHWLGWLITALAVSLGAPFWFDLLNKFIVFRSTVKPHEKSREEGSK